MNAPLIKALPPRPSNFLYSPMFPLGPDPTHWRKLDIAGVTTSTCDGQTVLRIKPEALSDLAFHGPLAFLRNYLAKGGFALGRVGLIVSTMNAYYVFLKFAKLWQLQTSPAARPGDGPPPV